MVECLNCGEARPGPRAGRRRIHLEDACPRCGYVGWAEQSTLTEATRRALRERPIERRRLITVA